MPSLATPLLVVRDPIAIGIIFLAIRYRLLYWNTYLIGILLIGLSALVTSLLVGHGNLYVALYGLRPMLIHFPLIFVIAHVFNQTDVEKVGKLLIWLLPPMTLLITLQFYSPQSALVNRGVGGDLSGAGFSGALGYFRPPGTFSFTNGNTLFFNLAACFACYFWLTKVKLSNFLLILSSICLFIAVPLSISRAYFFQLIITLGFTVMCTSLDTKALGRSILVIIILILSAVVLTQFSFFQIGIEAFTARLENASNSEGGLIGTLGERFLGSFFRGVSSSESLPTWGYGIGMGSNVGSMLLSGERAFLIAEEEWPRIVGEMGGPLGLMLILIRLMIGLMLSWYSFLYLISRYFLPWILLSFGLLQIIVAGWAQPTSLGFSILTSALIFASFNKNTFEDN